MRTQKLDSRRLSTENATGEATLMTLGQPQPDETGAKPVEAPLPKSRKALSRVQRELSQEDLSSPGVQKMLIEELERAEEENIELMAFRERFHSVDKDLAIAKQKIKGWTAMEIISTGCIAAGAFAYAPEAAKTQYGGWVAAAFGCVLTITKLRGAVFSR